MAAKKMIMEMSKQVTVKRGIVGKDGRMIYVLF